MNLSDLRLRVRAVFSPRRVERELDDELAFHLERETQKLLADGLSEADARRQAKARFGPVPLVADDCRDARGTSFVDNTARDVLFAIRTFRRAPLVACTIVSTVALGLSLVAVAFTMLNALLYKVDQVPGVDEMYAVEQPRRPDVERPRFSRAQFDALRRETRVFTDAYAVVPDVASHVDGRKVFGTFATGNIFDVLGVRAAIGRTLAPADDGLVAGRPVMILSHRGWERLFERDPAILARTMLVNGVTFDIVGVMPEGFRGLAVGPPDDYWAPLSVFGLIRPAHRGHDEHVPVDIIGRLKPGLSRETAVAGLAVWAAGQTGGSPIERGEARITLVPKRGTVQQPREAVLVTAPLFVAFGLILLVACANVTNLLLARAVVRQREIGIRLSLGATRRRLIRQLLTESLLLALAAAAVAFAISRVALEWIIGAVVATWPPDIGDLRLSVPDADWRVAAFLIVGAGVSTMFFGLAPALRATRIEPIRTIRGEIIRDARPGRIRHVLMGLQVGAAALLLISAVVFLRSAFAAATFDPGLRISDIVIALVENEATRGSVVQAIATEPSVAAIAASWPPVVAPSRLAFAEAADARATVAYMFVSPEYFGVLDIGVVRGRTFTPDERSTSPSVAIVSESTARAMWTKVDPIGQTIRLESDPQPKVQGDEPRLEPRTFTVVGIVRDVPGFRIAPFEKAVVYVPTSPTMPHTALVLRVRGEPDLVRQKLLDTVAVIDPLMDQIVTLRWVIGMETYLLTLGFWVTVGLGGLALVLTLSGLFSVLLYLVEQRTPEIGVRLALGATTRDVARLVLSQTLRPVGTGLLVGSTAAAGFSAVLLALPAAGPIGQIVHVLDPVAYIVSLLIIITSCLVAASIPAVRASRVDPTRVLRRE